MGLCGFRCQTPEKNKNHGKNAGRLGPWHPPHQHPLPEGAVGRNGQVKLLGKDGPKKKTTTPPQNDHLVPTKTHPTIAIKTACTVQKLPWNLQRNTWKKSLEILPRCHPRSISLRKLPGVGPTHLGLRQGLASATGFQAVPWLGYVFGTSRTGCFRGVEERVNVDSGAHSVLSYVFG